MLWIISQSVIAYHKLVTRSCTTPSRTISVTTIVCHFVTTDCLHYESLRCSVGRSSVRSSAKDRQDTSPSSSIVVLTTRFRCLGVHFSGRHGRSREVQRLLFACSSELLSSAHLRGPWSKSNALVQNKIERHRNSNRFTNSNSLGPSVLILSSDFASSPMFDVRSENVEVTMSAFAL